MCPFLWKLMILLHENAWLFKNDETVEKITMHRDFLKLQKWHIFTKPNSKVTPPQGQGVKIEGEWMLHHHRNRGSATPREIFWVLYEPDHGEMRTFLWKCEEMKKFGKNTKTFISPHFFAFWYRKRKNSPWFWDKNEQTSYQSYFLQHVYNQFFPRVLWMEPKILPCLQRREHGETSIFCRNTLPHENVKPPITLPTPKHKMRGVLGLRTPITQSLVILFLRLAYFRFGWGIQWDFFGWKIWGAGRGRAEAQVWGAKRGKCPPPMPSQGGQNRVLPPISTKISMKRAIFRGAARKFFRKIPFFQKFCPLNKIAHLRLCARGAWFGRLFLVSEFNLFICGYLKFWVSPS